MRPLTLLIVVIACGISVQKESNKGEPSIAIVGAGMSGLSAARRLIEDGTTNIDIYEGLNRIGGRLSPRVLTEFNDRGTEGESFLTNKFGYKAILDHLRLPIADNMIHFNTTVTKIDHSQEKITLTTSNGEIPKKYDYVIVTSSLGHLKKFHRQLFKPPLPRQKIEAIEKIGFGGSCKIFFRWEQPWWNNETYSMIPLPVEGMAREGVDAFERELTTLHVTDWEPNTLTAWVAGAGQAVMDNMTDQELKDRITKLIRDMKNDQTIQPPSEIIRTKLTKNDLLLGSYSYISLAQARAKISHSKLSIPIKQKNRLRVLFAGEATHHRLFQTAIGAYLSGRREADRILLDWQTRRSFLSTNRHDPATRLGLKETRTATVQGNYSIYNKDVVHPNPVILCTRDLRSALINHP
ncbi:amine oxidase [Necator americanus]|uniref:Amine oxidase n=1 Tax=Necator americanus TaxID=51031 RepID=W2SHP3_NECAM|nr:amine oxidase [Necator americanus]ETN68247.1 amine oxidase [Necator americanus]